MVSGAPSLDKMLGDALSVEGGMAGAPSVEGVMGSAASVEGGRGQRAVVVPVWRVVVVGVPVGIASVGTCLRQVGCCDHPCYSYFNADLNYCQQLTQKKWK